MSPQLRLALSMLLVGLWMAVLFVGWALGGAAHLLLLAGLAVVPWRELRGSRPRG